ncbi:MAG: transaldolase [Ilumatobacteraceae bacterium]
MTGRLVSLHEEQGQSPWLDNLQRGYLTSGHLDSLVRRGVRGLTSNPTIFQKAIQGSNDYDTEFHSLLASGVSPEEAYWQLVLSDIRAAADVFAPLHSASRGTDGFVSVEVDPRLARDTDGTVSAGLALRDAADRPNVMIKVPATREGIPAIRRLVAEGTNVNVTLIFGLQRYAEVMKAHIEGLRDRARAGLPVDAIAGVASFFISRVDTEIDRRLAAHADPAARHLPGRAAVAQAVLAYGLFRSTFAGPGWDDLVALGAAVQRPLWASTSTKNPAYPDTLYVDSLIGPDTVNTLPDQTLEAFDDHGNAARTIDSDPAAAREVWDRLESLGIRADDVAETLEREGLTSFVASFEDLLGSLEAKARG